jgi:hypothetical protein
MCLTRNKYRIKTSDLESYFSLPLESPGNWLVCCSWELAMPDRLALREETKHLAALLAPGFPYQTVITVADFNLLKSSAPTNGVAVAVLQQCIAGTIGTQEDLDCVRKRLASSQ